MRKSFIFIACFGVSSLLAGCGAMQMAVSKHNLDVQTKTSATVFLDPVPDAQKTVYVQVKNTSDKPEVKIRPQLVAELEDKGYHVTNHLNQAHYLLQANILKIGKTSQSAAEKALGGGYGSSVSGLLAGAATAATVTSHGSEILAGGLIGAGISSIADNLVKDVVYVTITDVQISERTKGALNQQSKSVMQQGTGGQVVQTSKTQSHWRRYRTRIVSKAEKVNLKFAQALPKLKAGLTHSLSGFF